MTKSLEEIIKNVEEKLEKLEKARDAVHEEIRIKEVKVSELENAIAKLEDLQSQLN